MVTVANLLAENIFSKFRLVSGAGGMDNIVTVTGFFDWEDGEEIRKAFFTGSFVLTTLSMFKDDEKEAERRLIQMINNHVSAIAIKDVFFSDISDALKAYSNKHNVPIFIFSDTYVNDIMHFIINEVTDDMKYAAGSSILEILIKNTGMDAADKQVLLNKINPHFHQEGIAALYISDSGTGECAACDLMRRYQETINQIKNLMKEPAGYDDVIYSLVIYKRGIFLILEHREKDSRLLQKYINDLVKQMSKACFSEKLYAGISPVLPAFSAEDVLKSAIYANVNCILENKKIRSSAEIGIDNIIFGNLKSEAAEQYMNQVMNIIADAEANNTPFMETILAYVQHDGNIEATSNILHQHKNTIRYRMEKIRKLLGDDDEITFTGKIFYIARVYRAKPYLIELI